MIDFFFFAFDLFMSRLNTLKINVINNIYFLSLFDSYFFLLSVLSFLWISENSNDKIIIKIDWLGAYALQNINDFSKRKFYYKNSYEHTVEICAHCFSNLLSKEYLHKDVALRKQISNSFKAIEKLSFRNSLQIKTLVFCKISMKPKRPSPNHVICAQNVCGSVCMFLNSRSHHELLMNYYYVLKKLNPIFSSLALGQIWAKESRFGSYPIDFYPGNHTIIYIFSSDSIPVLYLFRFGLMFLNYVSDSDSNFLQKRSVLSP